MHVVPDSKCWKLPANKDKRPEFWKDTPTKSDNKRKFEQAVSRQVTKISKVLLKSFKNDKKEKKSDKLAVACAMKIKEAAEKAQKEAEKESDTESVHLSDNSSDEESEDYSEPILEENNLYASKNMEG